MRQHFNFRLSDKIGTARNADIGLTDSGTVRWTRWTEGTLDVVRAGGVPPISFDENQGYHIIVGTPATNLPTTGRVGYQLPGGTRPPSVAGIDRTSVVSGQRVEVRVDLGVPRHIQQKQHMYT